MDYICLAKETISLCFHFLDPTNRKVKKPKIFPCKQFISKKRRFVMSYSNPIMKFFQIQVITVQSTKLQTILLQDDPNPNYQKMF